MKGDHRFQRTPKGSTAGGYARARVQIGFDEDMRQIIAGLAIVNNRSFAAEVRALLEQALRLKRTFT